MRCSLIFDKKNIKILSAVVVINAYRVYNGILMELGPVLLTTLK